jgi:hypothetical protein
MFVAVVNHDRDLRGVVVVLVVRRKLEMPFELAGIWIERK